MIPNQPQFQQQSLNIKYELTFKCVFYKKCKPIILLFERMPQLERIGVTEISYSKDNTKIEFKKSIIFNKYDRVQNLVIEIRDVNGEFKYACDHKYIGGLDTTLNDIISCPNNIFKQSCGSMTLEIQAHKLEDSKNNIIIKIEADSLDKKDLLSFSSDPYLHISKEVEGHGFIRVYESEIIKKCLSPKFESINLNTLIFNSNDLSKRIKFEILDYNKISAHELIGEFCTTTQDLLNGGKNEFEIINPKKKSSNYKHSGIVRFKEVTLVKTPTIFDYINGGFNINLMLGINCAASDENLHNIQTNSNQYIQAIQTVCSLLKPYTSSNIIKVQGFGCIHDKLNEEGESCNCKPFKLNEQTDKVNSIQDAVDIYTNNIASFSGFNSPSNFSELINYSSKKAKKSLKLTNNNSYTILVIFTHGDIPTGIYRSHHLLSIYNSSNNPISIIIVGIGSNEFEFTRKMDGDKTPIYSGGEPWKRDCVQFVQFNKYLCDPQVFSSQLVEELEPQFLSYVEMEKILPPR